MKIINICDDEVKIIDEKEIQYYKLECVDTNEGLNDINCIVGNVLTTSEFLKGITILING